MDTSRPVAFVTGASRGIGRSIALCLAAKGFNIVGAATQILESETEIGLNEVKARAEDSNVEFLPVVGDIANADDHRRMVQEAMAEFGRIDVLVNNAGVAPEQRLDVLETSPESYARVMGINLTGPFFFSQVVAKEMVRLKMSLEDYAPRIIFITSISATAASPNRAEYCISKAGLSMAAQTFAVRLAEFGIGVFEVQPGVIKTDMTQGAQQKYDDLIENGLLLQKRWGEPEDVGKAVASLASGDFDYATGAVIEVGGGFGVRRL